MAVSDIRQRTAVLFIAVMLGHILLISAQVNSKSGVPILEAVTFGAFSEVQRGASSLTGGIHNAWTGYVNLRGVRAENQQLKEQLAQYTGFTKDLEKYNRTNKLRLRSYAGKTK